MNKGLFPTEERTIRLVFVLTGLSLVWIVLVAKTFYTQVVQSGYYTETLKNQSEKRVMLKPRRGRIYDRNKVLLVGNYNGRERGNLEVRNKFRMYLNENSASHILGNVGWNGRGTMGVEAKLDRELYGLEGWKFKKVDARRRTSVGYKMEGREPSQGLDVVLTIDSKIQDMVEDALANQVEYVNAKSGTAIVLDPHNGEILALANYPDYNANFIKEEGSVFRNDAIQKVYEPGSTFKLITAAAALEEKKFNTREKIDTEGGRFSIYGDVIRDTHDYGVLSFAEALAYSSNVAFAKIATELGNETFFRYVRSFGFGMRTGVELPAEEKGRLKDVRSWSGRTLSTMAMGHEILVTPLQLVMAVAAIANGGELMRPMLVKSVLNPKDQSLVKENTSTTVRRVVSPETAHQLKLIMKDVVEYGTAKSIKSKNVTYSGKTGTAEKFDWEKKRYSHNKTNASFIGLIPAEDPKYVALVLMDEPEKYTSGARAAGPVFKEIAENLVVAPNENSKAKLYFASTDAARFSDWSEKGRHELNVDSLRENYKVSFKGNGDWIVAQSPKAGTYLSVGDSLNFHLGEPGYKIPDFHGMALSRVMEIVENKKIKLSVKGSGRVLKQSPKPGTDWIDVDHLNVSMGDML